MTALCRVRPHPTDPQAVILDVPFELNHAMAKFGPAMMAKEHKGFVMLAEHLDPFYRFAAGISLQIVDERAKPPGAKALMPECKHCGQPAKLLAQPDHCPACGKRWEPAFIDGRNNPHDPLTKACVRCGHDQIRKFAYCSQCGEVMPPDDDRPARRIVAARSTLADPMSLSDALHEAVDDMDDGPTTAEWAQLVRMEIRPCQAPDIRRQPTRQTTDVQLPSEETAHG